MKIIALLIALTFARTAIAQVAGSGFVGLTLSATDYGLVTDITPDTPAANSSIHVGDRIVSFGPIPLSQIHSRADLQKATSGIPGSQITLKGATCSLACYDSGTPAAYWSREDSTRLQSIPSE